MRVKDVFIITLLIILCVILIYLFIKDYLIKRQFNNALKKLNGRTFLDTKQRIWVFSIADNHEGFTLLHKGHKECIYINQGSVDEIIEIINATLLRIVNREH